MNIVPYFLVRQSRLVCGYNDSDDSTGLDSIAPVRLTKSAI